MPYVPPQTYWSRSRSPEGGQTSNQLLPSRSAHHRSKIFSTNPQRRVGFQPSQNDEYQQEAELEPEPEAGLTYERYNDDVTKLGPGLPFDFDFWSDDEEITQPTYKALPDGAFRLLHLLPCKYNEEIHCELVSVRLESPPQYEAISYAWGTSFNNTRIFLDGMPCSTRHNLVQCLRSLQRKDQIRVIWVDALCINQTDVEEKNTQVAYMSQIYRFAFRTLIWLGDNSTYTFARLTVRSYHTYLRKMLRLFTRDHSMSMT